MIRVLGIDHLVLRTTNVATMVAFYQAVLGCNVVRDELDSLGLIQLSAGDALIDLVKVDSELGRLGGGAPTKQNNNLDHFCLRLANISNEALESHLALHRVEREEFSSKNGAQGFGDSVYIFDPDGNRVELKSERVE